LDICALVRAAEGDRVSHHCGQENGVVAKADALATAEAGVRAAIEFDDGAVRRSRPTPFGSPLRSP
jgi:hypothetical protein